MSFFSKKNRLQLGVILTAVFLILGILGLDRFLYKKFQHHLLEQARAHLVSIEDLRYENLMRWFAERNGDIAFYKNNTSFITRARKLVENRASPEEKKQFQSDLLLLQSTRGYIPYLLDNNGRVLLENAATMQLLSDEIRLDAIKPLPSQQSIHFDFHKNNADSRIQLVIAFPLTDPSDGKTFGRMVWLVDPAQSIYPIVESQPVFSNSAETLLMQIHPGGVRFLSNGRFQKNLALNRNLTLDQTETPAIQAALGKTGLIEGRDYRNIPVLASIKRIPDTDWILNSKIDLAEIDSPLHNSSLLPIIALATLPLNILLLLLLLAYRHNLKELEEKQRLENIAQELERSSDQMNTRFCLLARSARTGSWELDLQSDALSWDEHQHVLYGTTPDHYPSTLTAFKTWVHPEDQPRVQALFEQAMAEKKNHFAEYRVQLPDGKILYIESQGHFLYGPDGKPQKVIGIHRDISQRKVALQHLRESEERFRTIFEYAHTPMLLLSNNIIISMNSAAARLLGYTDGPPPNLPSITDISPEFQPDGMPSREKARKIHEACALHGSDDFEWLHLDLNGKPVLVEVSLTSISVGGKSLFFCIWNDISKRKAAEEKTALLVTALESSPNAIVITNRDGSIEWVNPAFSTLTGYSFDEAIGKNPRVLKSGKHDNLFYKQLWDHLLRGEVWHGEIINKRKDGSLYTEELGITPIRNTQGDITHFIAIKQNITERKEMQAQLLRSQRLESVGRLASGVAHDLNNILTPVLMAPPLLRIPLTGQEQALKILDTIESSAKRGSDIVRQLLDFGRGSVHEDFILLRPKDQFHAIVEIARQTFPKNIRLTEDCPGQSWLINGNATQIHQVLLNLCVNARDAMPNGGTLKLSLRNIEFDDASAAQIPGARPGRFVAFAVLDTGCGIDSTLLDKIFDPFFTTKDFGAGTGLGLSTSLGIIKSHGGFILVQSQPGKGSEFTAYFPASSSKDDSPVSHTEFFTGKKTAGNLILLVDDEEEIRTMTRLILETHGYKILEAANGSKAYKLFTENKPRIDLVLTDVQMPVMGGTDLIRKIRHSSPHMKIIAMTGYNVETNPATALPVSEIQAKLTKPFGTNLLLHTIQQVLNGGTS